MWDLSKDCVTPFRVVVQDTPFWVHALTHREFRHYVLMARQLNTAARSRTGYVMMLFWIRKRM